jgi:hypothetical protein
MRRVQNVRQISLFERNWMAGTKNKSFEHSRLVCNKKKKQKLKQNKNREIKRTKILFKPKINRVTNKLGTT